MKKALLAVNTMTYFIGLVEIGRMLKKESGYKPVFYFPQPYPQYRQDLKICEREGMEYVCGFEKADIQGADASRLNPRQNAVKKFLLMVYRNFFVGFAYEFLAYFREFKKIKRLIKNVKPAIIIISGDNTGHNTDILIKVGHKYGVPSAIIPMFTTGPVEAAEAYFYNPAHDCRRFSNRILAYFEPKWVYKHKGKKLLRWPAFKILAMKIFGLKPPLPWIVNSSHADKIMVECEAVKEFMIKEGIPARQILLTGSLANDIMADHLRHFDIRRNELCEKLKLEDSAKVPSTVLSEKFDSHVQASTLRSNFSCRLVSGTFAESSLDKKKQILLCALPPNILYGYSRPECDFKKYDDLVIFWIKSLVAIKNYNVVISLHPAIKYEEIRYIEDFGVKIAKQKSIDLIPLCDLFVSAMSGTIYWATACRKPVLNYDVYRYRYSDFEDYRGIVYTEEKKEFQNLLVKFANDEKFYAKILEMQKVAALKWGVLDSKGHLRLLKAIDDLTKKHE
ncbi:hypothetical protein HY604_01730 [Candidatus Peregrinibacteria bacterium]|nr:hypothetical protein [Candidatus Peregrinibacteria bacterium]